MAKSKANPFVAGASLTAADLNGLLQFGGTGADGALSISSGTTTISCSSLGYLEKNYTSISITGTANLAFSSPNNNSGTTVALRSQGNVSITTSSSAAIDMRSMGGGVGTAYAFLSVAGGGGATNGGGGAGGCSLGGGIAGGGISWGSTGGTNFENILLSYQGSVPSPLSPYLRYAPAGGNGGSGGSGNSNGFSGGGGGGGGLGGGGLYIECGGTYTFTGGSMNLSGSVGGNGTNGTGGGHGGGGGGGAGGNILVLYNTLGTDSGTYTLTGGAGGTNTNSGTAGALGLALRMVNSHFD